MAEGFWILEQGHIPWLDNERVTFCILFKLVYIQANWIKNKKP